MNPNNFEKNKKYLTISIYVILTLIISVFLIKAIWNWSSTLNTISKLIEMLSPFLIGIFIAYLMNPLVNIIDKSFFKKLLRMKKDSLRKGLSILISYIIVIGIISFCISVIVPEVYLSLKNLYENLQGSYDKLIIFIDKINKNYPEIDISFLSDLLRNNSSDIINVIKNSLDTILPLLYNTSVTVIKSAINILIAIMVSCYLLIDKNRFLLNSKKLVYAIFSQKNSERLISTFKECNKIFGNFVIGKTIDSTIIGFLCYFFMNMLDLEYTMLISVIVGITNMIPYFGPFIGAIPGILILLTISWEHSLIFGIMVLILQQFDGLYLGPKILGESTGIRPVWIIFAITVGGWFFGPVGMFLGVPTTAVILHLATKAIDKKLKDKNIIL